MSAGGDIKKEKEKAEGRETCRLMWRQQRTGIKNEVPSVFEWIVLN